MINNIGIKQYRGIEECQLTDLKKVNIICGKNNSGKTTILEALNSEKASKLQVGVRFTEDEINRFIDYLITKNRSLSSSGIRTQFKELISKIFNKKELWFSDEFEIIWKEFSKQWDQDSITIDKIHFQEYLTKLFALTKKSILISPKRHIEQKVQIQTKTKVMPNGDGIVNFLFNAKNSSDFNKQEKFEKLKEVFKWVSSGFIFDILTTGSTNEIILEFAGSTGEYRTASECGLGLQDILILLFFTIFEDYNFLLIEEPENHLHPEFQRRLVDYYKNKTNERIQFIISTHSNVFLDPIYTDKVFFISYDGKINVSDYTSRALILNDLGFSVTDNLVSDLVILTEGPTDTPILEEFFNKMDLLSKFEIKIWPLGGDIMDQLDLSVIKQDNQVIAIIDNDPGSRKIRGRFIANCKKNAIKVIKLERYAIENYFSIRALREVFHGQFPENITEILFDTKLEDQLGFDVKKNNRKIAREMTIEEIEGTDLLEFLLKIKSILEE